MPRHNKSHDFERSIRIAVSSPAGEANYRAARRRYPAQAIVDLATLRDNMAHLVDVVAARIPARR